MTRIPTRALALSLVFVAGGAFAGDCFNSPEDEYLYTSNEPSPLRVTDAARSHGEAAQVERRAQHGEATAWLSQQVLLGDEGVLEVDPLPTEPC